MSPKTKLLPAALAVALSGCVLTTPTDRGEEAEVLPSPVEYLTELRGSKSETLNAKFIEDGIEALQEKDAKRASRAFNRALKFDPTNSSLHFFNGLAYHLMVAAGDASQLEFAKIGYDQALRFNPANAWAAYQRGLIYYREQDFSNAQDMFAYAANYLPKNEEVLNALAAASYQAQDLPLAAASASRLLAQESDSPVALRNAAMVYGAAGQFDRAREALKSYAALKEGSGYRHRRLEQRLEDWRRLHAGGIQYAQSILGDSNTTEGLTPSTDGSGGFGDSTSSNSTTGDTTNTAPPEMLLVDVAIIRTEESSITNKGFNLLAGLMATYAGTIINFAPTSTLGAAATRTLQRSHVLSIPTVTYNLNIFSDSNDVNEIIARPTLVAIDGQQSEFFSGAVWHVELSSSSAAGVSSGVTDVPIGIDLKVTPTFLPDGKVQLNVTAARAFIETTAAEANFTNFSQTSKTTVTANVVMEFGQTLAMSGLSEKETEKVKTGVPILQDIPGVQYLFSNQTTLDLNKSVLVLLTPRKPRFTEADGSPEIKSSDADGQMIAAAKADNSGANVKRLKKRSEWAFAPANNLDAVVDHLSDRRFFREFRSGDVALEEWDNLDSVRFKVLQNLEFLYF